MIARCFVICVILIGSAGILRSQSSGSDWPQFRGPNRDGVAASFSEPKAWPDRLTQVWKVDVGEGHASPILVSARVYTFTRQGTNEVMQALDAATGKAVWQTRYPAPVNVNPAAQAHGPGPKATPTYADGRLFTLGMGGIVTAFDAASGKQLWQKPAGSVLPLYGTAMSPLVDRGSVIVHVGGHGQGALTAFDASTGAVKWAWNGDGPSYASPVAVDIEGVRQIITLTQENVVGLSAADGRLLWRRPFSTEYTQNIITPIVMGNIVIVSGVQKPTSAFRLVRKGDQWNTEDVWENPGASFYMANEVVVGDALFGLSSRNSGQYVLLDMKTGKTLWTGMPRQATNAAIVRAGAIVFALEDDAELMVGRVSGNGVQELKRYKVADAATWAAPVVSGNRVFVKDVSSLTLFSIS
ncbi:MAG TPA: PQQ-binding-like beta-propeller repeat protein [Vicinamibacterales bacterium]|nr:PQQ-binding-like beta-propeller repeat protein [Vicinamibacterales bacterium]